MKQKTEYFKCGKCLIGKVKRILKETKKGGEIKTYKCDNCKYQNGIREVDNLELLESEEIIK